ncbi:MAG: SIMPL domain-containing protein, partial [Thermoproteota archaeon]|nr:SIMPL domain-containing protein [Thermoproteota archaeon]
ILTTLGILATLALVIIFLSQIDTASAQTMPIQNMSANVTNSNNTLSVSGNAFTKVKPDRVVISIGVETTDKTAKASLAANSELMNKIIIALRNLGIKENETSTSSFTISPNYNYTESGTILNITGFTVTNSIQIDSSTLANISSWIDAAVASGANSINSIDFTISNKILEDTKNMLIKDAIANAEEKADIVSSALGLKVNGLKSITVGEFGYIQPPQPFMAKGFEAAGGGAAPTTITTPILAGEQEVSGSVNIVFLIG